MKTTKITVNSSEIASFIDLDLPDTLSDSDRDRVKEEVGELILDGILSNVGKARSPVAGYGAFPELSSDYKKEKKEDGRGTKASLESSGDMMDALKFSTTDEGVKIGIEGSQAGKADGHNNFSGKSRLPLRRFLPDVGESFVSDIESGVAAIVRDAIASGVKIDREELRQVQTKSELNSFLNKMFPDLSVREAKSSILIDDRLRTIFFSVLELF